MAAPKRITLVTDELLGYTKTGGLGTATTYLAVALGRMGHKVELLASGDTPAGPMADEWARLYSDSGVEVRALARSGARIEPSYFARMRDVEAALAADTPDVVIAQELAAPAYTALRTRDLGLGFEDTLFVVYCHGGRRWITDMARKVRVLPGAHAVTELERACVEIADVVVSPSAYLLDWMRNEGWRLPDQSLVIPYFNRSAATDEPPQRATRNGERVERVAFFGRLEERKGLEPFAAAVNALQPELLRNVELDFVGAETPAWPRARIESLFGDQTRQALRGLIFATDLDQPEALALLSRPGTLAVMPSLEDNSPNAVMECIEHGIPFLSSATGGIPELVAREDRQRVLFEPSAAGIADALRRALSNADALTPARAAFDATTTRTEWTKVVDLRPQPRVTNDGADAVLVHDGDCELDDDCLDTLRRAQAASQADVVTCGVRLSDGTEHLFHGDPRGLGVIANHYGTVGLVRRSLLGADDATEDPWSLYTRLSLDGATIVSVPRALARQQQAPGDVRSDTAAAVRVVDHFERRLPRSVRSLARLAAGLAAAPRPAEPPRRNLVARALDRL